ncbi:MAG TPA: STAS domain-containing protein [Planctomycetota bacterium]|nr:STAS domain-containing protein [Planctomycetota bacterium]
MEFTREDRDGLTLVRLTGEVDMRSSPELRKGLLQVAKESVPHVAVSLEHVTYIDSSGIATLIECLKNVSRYGGKLTLIGVNEDIYPVFELAHLHDVFDLHRDVTID